MNEPRKGRAGDNAYDGVVSDDRSNSAEVDNVRVNRARIARYTLIANRVGYLMYALCVSLFVMAFALGFSGPIVSMITVSLIVGSILLAPSIVLGYAVKAAEREDRERGI